MSQQVRISEEAPDRESVFQTAFSTSGASLVKFPLAILFFLVGTLVASSNSSNWWSVGGTILAVLLGALHLAGDWCFIKANYLSRVAYGEVAAQINAIYYLVPIGALLLLWGLTDTTIERPDLLIAGAAGVIAVNMILQLDPEGARQRADRSGGHGYAALVIAIWTTGVVVYFRDDILPAQWQVWSVVEYWGIIGVCATVFILILSFRQSRLANRQREMDALMLQTHQKLIFMGEFGDLTQDDSDEAARLLREVDKVRDPSKLDASYLDIRRLLLKEMHLKSDREKVKRQSDLLVEVEMLVNLRQQGRNFTELAVLGLLAILTVVLAVAARPEGDMVPFASWVHDTTSMVIAATFAFLGFDLIDKRREADAATMCEVNSEREAEGHPKGWRLQLLAYQKRTSQRILALLLGAVLLFGAVTMLGFKWL